MKNKKIWIALAAVAVIVIGALGIYKLSDPTRGKEVVVFATPDTGPAMEKQQEIVDNYNASQDQYYVELQAYGSAFDQKFSSALAAGNPPDVVKMWNYPAYYTSLMPLDEVIANDIDNPEDFYDTLWNYSTVDGQVYGIPVGFSTRAMYYDPGVLEEAGVTLEPGYTTEDFSEAVAAVAETGNTPLYAFYNPDPYAMEQFLWTFGSEGWIANDGTANVNDPANAEALQWFHDLIYVQGTGYVDDMMAGGLEPAMASGDYAFTEFGVWSYNTIKESNEDLAVMPLPGNGTDIGYSTVHASFLSIPSDAANPEGAIDFINYYVSPENMATLSEVEMPTRPSVAQELGYEEDPFYSVYYDELEASSAYQSSLLKTDKWADVNAELAATLETIFSNETVDIQAELDKCQEKVETILAG